MDFSKLNQNEKLAVYGAVGRRGRRPHRVQLRAGILAVLAAVAMLAIVFLPQFSPQHQAARLAGQPDAHRAAASPAIGAAPGVPDLTSATWLHRVNIRDVFFLLGVAGGLLMGWAGWQEFQAEGGKFQSVPRPPQPPAPTQAASSAGRARGRPWVERSTGASGACPRPRPRRPATERPLRPTTRVARPPEVRPASTAPRRGGGGATRHPPRRRAPASAGRW